MSELKDGILNVNGFLLSKNTKPQDLEALSAADVKIEKSRKGDVFVQFLKPIFGTGFMGYVSVDFYIRKTYPEISIMPKVIDSITSSEDRAKIALFSSKKWLKSVIGVEPTTEDGMSILYKFDWGHILADCWQDRDYGLMGGGIGIKYEG